MKTFDVRDKQERLVAFEISNFCVSRSKICSIISQIPNTEILRKPKLFSSLREEEFCEFKIGDHNFVIWEPFGDSSRYHIACTKQGCEDVTKYLKEYFEKL